MIEARGAVVGGVLSRVPGPLDTATAGADAQRMTERDPRERFRQLPEPVRREELVESQPADPALVVETPADSERRQLAAGGGPV